MNVGELMAKDVKTCRETDDLASAAQIMWENDCGCVPVVDSEGQLWGIITDRDICMAAYTQGVPLHEIPISSAASREVHSTFENDTLDAAERTMRKYQVRRLPVTDGEGRLRGLLSLNDLARHAHRGRKSDGLSESSVAQTLAAIAQPRGLLPEAPSHRATAPRVIGQA